jgi:hypothetical protein
MFPKPSLPKNKHGNLTNLAPPARYTKVSLEKQSTNEVTSQNHEEGF